MTKAVFYIVLENDAGDTHPLSGADLSNYLDGTTVRLVVLAACETAVDSTRQRFVGVAQRLMRASNLPAVVAMQFAIPDASAIAFNRGFYSALADGYPVDAALADGRMAILEVTGTDQADWATPLLLMRAEDGQLWRRLDGQAAKSLTKRGSRIRKPAPPNPFGDTGRITEPKRFFDRQDILRQIFEELGNGSNLSLVGGSQIGKSSVLSMICKWGPQRLKRPREAFIYLSLQWVHDEEDFYEALCDQLRIPSSRGYSLARKLKGKNYVLCLDEV